MTTLEELQAARDDLRLNVFEPRTNMYGESLMNCENFEVHCSTINTICKVLDEAISKMETTTEQSSGVDENDFKVPRCSWGFFKSVLSQFIYETTHLSPENDDGSHDCRISKKCLLDGRVAMEVLQHFIDKHENTRAEPSQTVDAFDYHRVKEWAVSNPRKPANQAFTDSTNRQVAYLIDDIQAAQTVEPIEGLEDALHEHDKEDWNMSDENVRILAKAARAYLTLTKREG